MPVRNTSIDIYNEMLEEGIIGDRQAKTFDWLREFRENLGFWPTAAELSEYLDYKGVEGAGDPNFVRPRLTELKKELHLVDEDPRRSCFSRKSGHPNKISRYPSERPRVNRDIADVDWDSLMRKVEDGNLPKEEFKPGDHDLADSGPEVEEITEEDISETGNGSDETDREQEEDEENPVITPSESEEAEDSVDEEPDEEDDSDNSPEAGEVIYGEEDSDSNTDSEDSEEDDSKTMTVDGVDYTKQGDVWVSEDGQDYVFPPGKDEDDYDLEELDQAETSEDPDENRGQEKVEKETSLNQY